VSGQNNAILILSDTLDFGGHEIAFLSFLDKLLTQAEYQTYHFIVPAENKRFIQELQSISDGRIEIIPSKFYKLRGEPYRAPFRIRYKNFIREQYNALKPKTVLLLQGRIEHLCTAALALPRCADLVSYLPMAHLMRDLRGPSFSSRLQDALRMLYYRLPKRYIVPSNAVAAQLRENRFEGPIQVARNFVPAASSASKGDARTELSLPQDKKIAAFIGRFDVRQKGIDLLLPLVERSTEWHFLFIGAGEYAERIALTQKQCASVSIVSWTERVELYLQAIDVLLLPSRYEGVPLVLLQALRAETPVMASFIDAYIEYLPAKNLSTFDSSINLDAELDRLIAPDAASEFQVHARRVVRDAIDFDASFKSFLNGLTTNDGANS